MPIEAGKQADLSMQLRKIFPVPAELEIFFHHSLQVEELQDRLKVPLGFNLFLFPFCKLLPTFNWVGLAHLKY